ncbi:Magnesium transporter MRS2/LPE10 [Penicillium samsonianum]|uniref:Magnesium transporter MRS2/LPE10 n=1 Tax=Penicillium samsonianum TaxID=1882272 RepID=UPI002548F321|nr:Magnesium transporter MRS2/LPE10 [Penicillium samsonianum]KAJ6142497.1 Magnesium transporter MRS2/LPE10 [Penicillium samsonianum]
MEQPKIRNIPSYGRRGIITLPNKSHHVIQEPDMKKEASFNQKVFNLSLALSQSRINDATELRCMVLDLDGSVKESETRGTRNDLAKQWGLDGRDLRNVDLVSEGIPHLLVRPSVIFISMFTLRLLVRSHGVLLFLLPIEDCHVKVQDVFMTDLQSRLRPGPGSGLLAKLPFEIRVVDAALASVIATLEAEHVLIRREVEDSLRDSTREDVVYSVLRGLQDHRKRLVAIQQRARQFRSALREILENDEDMATMFLTDRQAGRPHEVEDHLEVEYLLEAYYKNTDAIAESASALVGDLERTTESIQSILDVRRNQILVFEAQLEICMLGFAVSTFVAGLFGMNVANFFEETRTTAIMPEDNYGNEYSYKSSGENSQGNHYCSRDYGSGASNSNSYHYSNQDGSYYYSNSDGSKYYNSGKGDAVYTPPSAPANSSQNSGNSGKSGK